MNKHESKTLINLVQVCRTVLAANKTPDACIPEDMAEELYLRTEAAAKVLFDAVEKLEQKREEARELAEEAQQQWIPDCKKSPGPLFEPPNTPEGTEGTQEAPQSPEATQGPAEEKESLLTPENRSWEQTEGTGLAYLPPPKSITEILPDEEVEGFCAIWPQVVELTNEALAEGCESEGVADEVEVKFGLPAEVAQEIVSLCAQLKRVERLTVGSEEPVPGEVLAQVSEERRSEFAEEYPELKSMALAALAGGYQQTEVAGDLTMRTGWPFAVTQPLVASLVTEEPPVEKATPEEVIESEIDAGNGKKLAVKAAQDRCGLSKDAADKLWESMVRNGRLAKGSNRWEVQRREEPAQDEVAANA